MEAPLLRETWRLGHATVSAWLEDEAPRLGAALAFYSVLSLAPFVVIAVGIAGIVYGDGAVGAVQRELEALIGPDAGRVVTDAAANVAPGLDLLPRRRSSSSAPSSRRCSRTGTSGWCGGPPT